MVKVTLVSSKGNAARFFPHAGFLALTPVKLEGVVRTRLDDDRKPLQAADLFVAVRCYEARLARTGVAHTALLVDHRVPLWSKQPHEPWSDLGDGDWPFRLVLPPSLPGHSTAHFQEYRVFWRIEAVLNHIPLMGLGHRQVKTFDLPLIRYDPGDALPPPNAAWVPADPAKLPLRYLINTPPFPLGPTDLVPVAIKLAPADPAVRVDVLALAIERRLEFNDPRPDDTSLSSTTNLVARPPRKAATFLVASASATDVPPDEHGVFAKTVTLQIPTQKSASHWAVGETMRTALVTLRFFLRVKVTLAHANGVAETLELGERELCLVATNESQRRLAVAQHAEAVERARTHAHRVPSPSASPPLPPTPLTASSLHNKGSAKPKSARRPHTSAGPRDAAREVARGASRRAAQGGRTRPRHTASAPGAPEESPERAVAAASHPADVRAWEDELARIEARSHVRTVVRGGSPPLRSAPAGRSGFVPAAAAAADTDTVLAWEEELERIAAQSRRRSVAMLGERRMRPRIETPP